MSHLRKSLDHFSLKAKASGFPARSVFKLEEIQAKYKILARGQRVLDLGCSPGSWTQKAADIVGPLGSVLGIDLTPVTTAWPPHVRTLEADIFKWQPEPAMRGTYDVLMSDMMSNTTGACGSS
jgi:23S rRNA (uridine2552-2'-O)-methyltransferase